MTVEMKGKIGFGTAPLGNMFRDIPERDWQETVQSVWNHGIRYFDTAPLYGAGLSEIRLGEVLSQYNRDDYVLSTKVGRLISDEKEDKEGLFEFGRKNKVIDDYTTDGTLRSIEQSLERLKTDRLDMVFVHDISPDFHGDEWVTKFDEARNGAFRVLSQLKEEGVIGSWGIGVNTTMPIEMVMKLEEATADMCLSATQYTLMQHERALERMMKTAEEKGVGIVVGGPYNSGALLGGKHFDYVEATPAVKKHVQALNEVAKRYDVSLKAAALQFSSAHPAVRAVIPGSTRPERIKEDLEAMKETIPSEFWDELIKKELLSAKAPLPR